jgi:Tfp pilus assembly protein PilO
VKRLTDKQLLLATIAVPVLVVAGIGWMAWLDWQRIYAAEMSDDRPEAAEITDPEQWGEKRKCQEIRKEMAKLHVEADLIVKRETDVIVYREIVQRDSQILPDQGLVNEFTNTIDDFARTAGVTVTSSAGLNETGDPNQAIRKVPIRLALSGSFDQFLKFVNLFETMDRIVNTKQFSLSAGTRSNDDPSLAPVHGISLEMETYVYNPGAGLSKPVEIAGYEKRKEDPAIQKQIRQQKAARVDKYQLKPRINRRDPLVDPRRSRTGPEAEGLSADQFEALRKVVDALKVEVETLKEDVRLEQQYLQEKKYLQYVQLKALNDDKVLRLETAVREADPKVVVAELREIYQDEVKTPFERIAGERAKKGDGGFQFVLRAHVAEFLEKQKTAFEAREYEKCERTG